MKRRKLSEEITDTINEEPELKTTQGLVSTGSTLLNLALSDDPKGGYALGKIVNIIGDSSAGKSFLLWTMFAEAIHSGNYDDYDIIYDDAEHALEFNIAKLFGKKVESKVITDTRSDTIEDFHDNVMSALGIEKQDKRKKEVKEKNIIYGLDSFDALSSTDELERDIREGSYRMEKPKKISETLRKIVGKIDNTKSLVVIISQTRDNIGVMFGEKKTRSGGRALKFYCTHEIWLAVKGHVKRAEREVGVNVIAKIKKNKLTGKQNRVVEFPIYYDYGIDDTLSCVNFLIEEKIWSKTSGKIDTKGFLKENEPQEVLLNKIDNNIKLKSKLKELIAKTWYKIEDEIKTDRVPKYKDED